MPIFEVQGPDGKTYEVDAPNLAAAAGVFSTPASTPERRAGRETVKKSMTDEMDWLTPSYDPMGAATGGTERVPMPSKADPIGRGAMSVFPFGADIAAMSRSGALPMSAAHSAEKERIAGEGEAAQEAYPKPYMTGQAGSLAAQLLALRKLPLPGSTWGTAALPEGATLGQHAGAFGARVAGGGVGGATMGGVMGLGEGNDLGDRLKHGAIGTAVGGALGAGAVPLVEGLVGGVGGAYNKFVAPTVQRARAAFNPETVAGEKVGSTLARGRQMTNDEFAGHIAEGEPVILADVGGESTRGIARYAANASPEARATLNEGIRPRYASQSERFSSEVEGLFPNRPDYAKDIDRLTAQRKKEVGPAYDRAYEQGSTGVFNDKLYNFTGSPTVRDAMRDVTRRAKDQEAYGTPIGEIIDPFAFNAEGQLVAKQGMKAGDANLAYWDIVKRNLDDQVTSLYKQGKNDVAKDIADLRNKFRDTLDEIVPSYKKARGDYAKFMGAENAYEAGINLSRMTKSDSLSVALKDIDRLSETEKELLARGYASDLIGKIERASDKRSIINNTFLGGSPVERAKLREALGPERATALEARMRLEEMMDSVRRAVGENSTTVRQNLEQALYGSVGTGAGFVAGDDIKSASIGGMAGLLLRAGKGKIDVSVANEIAKILVSRDPAMLERVSGMAVKNPAIIDALRNVQDKAIKGVFNADRSLAAGQIAAPSKDK